MKNIEKYYAKKQPIWRRRYNFVMENIKQLTDLQRSYVECMTPEFLTKNQDETLRQIEKSIRVKLKNKPDPDHVITEKELKKWKREVL
jgi:hypothetical protein